MGVMTADCENGENMGLKKSLRGMPKTEKFKNSSITVSRSRFKLWMIRTTTLILLWTCMVQLTALGEMWAPRILKGWPSCYSSSSMDVPTTTAASTTTTTTHHKLVATPMLAVAKQRTVTMLPPKSQLHFFLHYQQTAHTNK